MKQKTQEKQIEVQEQQKQDQFIATKEQLGKKKISLTLYIGNLPITWSNKSVVKNLSQFGKIVESKMMKKRGTSGRTALVKFQSLTEAENAIFKLKNKFIMGAVRPVNIKWLDTQEQRLGIGEKDDYKLFVGSLPRQVNESTLVEVFSIFGKIQNVKLSDKQFWAFIDYERKESALLAIKYLNGQAYLHGSHIPIEVRFRDKTYNSLVKTKYADLIPDPFVYIPPNLYHQVYDCSMKLTYYFNYNTGISQYEVPPLGARVYFTAGGQTDYYIQQEQKVIVDPPSRRMKIGPLGSNIFLFQLPHDMKESELYNLFKRFGNIYSVKLMGEKDERQKGIGFVSFDNPVSAENAIKEMNGFEMQGKRLKVELKKEKGSRTGELKSMRQANQYI